MLWRVSKLKNKVMKEIAFVIKKAEEEIWSKSGEVLLEMYWYIGYVLRDLTEREIRDMSENYSNKLSVDDRMFELAYHFYQDNPIFEKAVRCAK
jgi:hypothetical protein